MKTIHVPLHAWASLVVCLGSYSHAASPGAPTAMPPRVSPSPQTHSPGTNTTSADQSTTTYLKDVLPILLSKCFRCHNDQHRILQNWVNYPTAYEHRVEIKRRVWNSWIGHYYKQPMPLANGPESLTITPEERRVIKHWVDTGAAYGVQRRGGSSISKMERMDWGKQVFNSICAACHQPTGLGLPNQFPPLAGSDFLNADKNRAIDILLHGLQGEITVNGQKFNNSMPVLPLSNEDIAGALTYVYNSFGNSGKEVTTQEVTAMRAKRARISFGQQPSKRPDQPTPFE